MTLSSGLDLKSIYRPPSTLQLPGGAPGFDLNESAFSQPESMSSSSSQSSIGSAHGIQTELAAECGEIIPKPRNRSEVIDSHLLKLYSNSEFFKNLNNRIRWMTSSTHPIQTRWFPTVKIRPTGILPLKEPLWRLILLRKLYKLFCVVLIVTLVLIYVFLTNRLRDRPVSVRCMIGQ